MTADPDEQIRGRIVITWPAPREAALSNLSVVIQDADTGEPITCGFHLVIEIGSPSGWERAAITATLTELVGHDGEPLRGQGVAASDLQPSPEYTAHRAALAEAVRAGRLKLRSLEHAERDAEFTGARYATITRRYAVAEMRVAEPTKETV